MSEQLSESNFNQLRFNNEFDDWVDKNVPDDARAAIKSIGYYWYLRGRCHVLREASGRLGELADIFQGAAEKLKLR